MQLTLNLRGVDLLAVEFHFGSKGLYLDVDWFKPVEDDEEDEDEGVTPNRADLSGTPGGSYERAEPFGAPDTSVGGNGYDPDGRLPVGFQRS